MIDYLTARRNAGTPRGDEYAQRLGAMPPADAADEIADMFQLCGDEDLAIDISEDLQLSRDKAEPIAAELRKMRRCTHGDVMVILIDPGTRTVIDIGFSPGDRMDEQIRETIDFYCSSLRFFPVPNGLDYGIIGVKYHNEGLFKSPAGYFRLGDDGQPLAGRCLIVAHDIRSNTPRDASMTVDEVAALVIWGPAPTRPPVAHGPLP
jgi:hypothetical protein